MRGASPVSRNVTQGQSDRLRGRFVTGKVTSRLDDLVQLPVDILNRIRRVDDLANRRGKCEERDHAIPGVAP